ncbi:MAG TPA: ATPase, T2SS/T4P/T4SS family [Planctomycetaceae bacterium]|nr:ATPase, T2SS/T4P/T4SS family [Planctomycetaceae bacterium]
MLAEAIAPAPNAETQSLKARLHRQLIDALDLSQAAELSDEELRTHLRALANHLGRLHARKLDPEDSEALVEDVLCDLFGYGPLERLMRDPEVGEVLVNGPHQVLVELNGRRVLSPVRFEGEEQLLQFIRKLVARAGRRIDETNPLIDVRLQDGVRVQAAVPPLSLRGPTLSLRRAREKSWRLTELVKRETLAPEIAEFLAAAVRGRLNVLIVGAEGSGKTTVLNALTRAIPTGERIASIETISELHWSQSDVIAWEARAPEANGSGAVSLSTLLGHALRLDPQRIVIGELSGGETLEFLQALRTGHDGSLATLFAQDAEDALDRLEMLTALGGVALSSRRTRRLIQSAVPVIVQVSRLSTGARKVVRVAELVRGPRGSVHLEDIFLYRTSGIDGAGNLTGAFYATGYEPEVASRLSHAGLDLPASLFEAHELGRKGDA